MFNVNRNMSERRYSSSTSLQLGLAQVKLRFCISISRICDNLIMILLCVFNSSVIYP